MKTHFSLKYWFIAFLLLSACEKLDLKRQVIFTKGVTVTEVKTTSVRASGNLLDNGGGTIAKAGFVYSTSPLPTFESAEGKVEINTFTGTNRPIPISATITGLKGGTTYFVRVFAFNDAGMVGYSEDATFTTTNNPEITNNLPASAVVGDEITLTGANFGANPTLTLQGASTQPIRTSSANDTRIVFRIPFELAAGNYSVIVNNGQASSSSLVALNINPTVTDYTDAGFIGELWSVNGTGFGSEIASVKVSLGTNNLTVTRVEPSRITVTLPRDATGTFKPIITVNSRSVTGSKDFTIKPAPNAWIRKGLMPNGSNPASGIHFTYNGKGYAGLENNAINLYEYDPSTDKWSIKNPSYPGTKRYAGGWAMIGTKLYFGSGRKAVDWSDELYEYDFATDKWTQKANIGDKGSESYNKRNQFFVLNNTLYKSFGYQNIDGVARCLDREIRRYDATANTWTLVKEPKGTNCNTNVFSVGNDAYQGFGFSSAVYKLNATTLEWEKITDYPEGSTSEANICVLNNFLYVFGTYLTDTPRKFSKQVYRLNLQTRAWEKLPELPFEPRSGATIFALNGLIYFGGGYNNDTRASFTDFWEYTPPN
ncbi:MAG: hypothetical protein EAZ08_13190 [Cytophagales bacterium]|nr:MAG: hypothetical protein EAZ08_13190 [Cytophagales bacterium]